MRYVCVSAHTACVMRHVCHATLTMPPATPLSSTASNQEPRTGCIAHKPVRWSICKDGSALRLVQASSLPPCQRQTQMYWFAGGVAKMRAASWRRKLTAIPRVAARVYSYFGNRGCVTDVTEIRRAGRPEKVNSLGAPRPRAECAAARGLETTRPRDLHRARDPGRADNGGYIV